MNFLLKTGSAIAVLSLFLVAPANATPIKESLSNSPNSSDSFLIASPFQKEISPAYQRRKKMMEMLVLQMQVSEVAEEAMNSDDPEVKKMAKEVLDASNLISAQILDMLDPRKPPFRNDR